MNPEEKKHIATAIHMLKCNITTIRYGVVRSHMDIIVESINEMDRTIPKLEDQLANSSAEKTKVNYGSALQAPISVKPRVQK